MTNLGAEMTREEDSRAEEAARKALLEDLREDLQIAERGLRTSAPRERTGRRAQIKCLRAHIRAVEEPAPANSFPRPRKFRDELALRQRLG
jgi:hypothetical protein